MTATPTATPARLRTQPVCEFWLQEPGLPQRRCGATATHFLNRPAGVFFYCDNCAARARDLSRGKLTPHRIP